MSVLQYFRDRSCAGDVRFWCLLDHYTACRFQWVCDRHDRMELRA